MKDSHVINDKIELWIEDGILFAVLQEKLKILTLENAKEIVADRLKVSNGISRPFIIDLSKLAKVDLEARKYMATGDAVKLLNATAILVKNQLTKLMANIYIRINRPEIPTRFFENKEEAILWLEKFKYNAN